MGKMDNRKIAILLSGRGSNFVAIHEAIQRGDLNAEICCVISNVEGAGGLDRARQFGLDAICLPSKGVERAEYDRLIVNTLRPYAPALICLAGFMRIITPVLLKEYPSRVMNIHPALLPSFPGLHAQRQALQHAVKVSGCTVHLADEGVDTGPILLQRAVEVLNNDTEETLSERILEQEHQIYWRAIALMLNIVNLAGN
jgi:phosphoribosylglycinamide formyltransferase-1